MLGAAEFGELPLQFADLRAEDEAAVIDHPADRLVHAGADAAALRPEIDELDRLGGLRGGRQGRDIRHYTISSMRSGPASR